MDLTYCHDGLPPTYASLAREGKGRMDKTPFIGVECNVGSTSYHDIRKKKSQQFSFGCPRFFMRFSFTSAISDVPYAYVDWCNFVATDFYRTTFKGHITQEEWSSGPRSKPDSTIINPFMPCDDFIASRFVLAYKSNLDVAFIALEPERVGRGIIDDGTLTDLGDNVLEYLGGSTEDRNDGHYMHNNLHTFLTTKFE